MKNQQLTRQIFKKAGLASFILLSQLSVVHAVDVTINGSQPLPLSTNISYNYQSSPGRVTVSVDAPFVCSSVSNTAEALVLRLRDANGVLATVLDGGILSTIYDFANGEINFISDDTLKCASEAGFHREVITELDFERGTNDLQIRLLDANGQPFSDDPEVSDQQSFIYQYVIDNNGPTSITADISEFYRSDQSVPFFGSVAGDDWVCEEMNQLPGSTTSCGNLVAGEATVSLTNAVINSGEQLVVTASRTVEIPTGTLGRNIELLAAGFVKNGIDAVINNNVVFVPFGTTDNNAPTITAIADQTILEDSASDVLTFTVSDVESAVTDLVVTASSSNTAIVPTANIVVTGTGAQRTVQVTPSASTNTAQDSVNITLTVSDGITNTDETFSLDVTPVNDAPSFTLLTIPDAPAGTVGGQNIKGFVQNLVMGDSPDEASQSIVETTIVVQSDPNEIFAENFAPFLSNGGFLTYGLSGKGGTATVEVTLRDDGGTANGGVDTSDTVSFTITVLNTLPEISTVANQIIDEDGVSNVINFTVSDAETLADDLLMTATSSDTSIVPISGIQFSGTGENRSVVITPAVDQNTVVSGPVTITLIVNDGSDVRESSFELTINPINDAPTFDLGADIVWPASTSGLEIHSGFISNISLGPTIDEDNTQSISDFNVTITGDAIFNTSGLPEFSLSGDVANLAYLLNGDSGTATIEISLRDDAGVLNGGVDTSVVQSFTITVEQ